MRPLRRQNVARSALAARQQHGLIPLLVIATAQLMLVLDDSTSPLDFGGQWTPAKTKLMGTQGVSTHDVCAQLKAGSRGSAGVGLCLRRGRYCPVESSAGGQVVPGKACAVLAIQLLMTV